VLFYQHNIADWMDGTESLDAEPYRTYHVICQLIYQNEEPICNNEHGIAGRCKQSLKTYRTALAMLIKLGKLTLQDGRIANVRAEKELKKVDVRRINSARGGKNSAGVPKMRGKPLKGNGQATVTLSAVNSLKDNTRQEDTIKDSDAHASDDGWPADYGDVFWKLYPNKVGKPKALIKLAACRKRGITWSEVIEGLRRYVRDKPPDRPWLNPETFINQERWGDQPALPLGRNPTSIL
jgi:uncharacterized protein YdaU (DUF1376 family)